MFHAKQMFHVKHFSNLELKIFPVFNTVFHTALPILSSLAWRHPLRKVSSGTGVGSLPAGMQGSGGSPLLGTRRFANS